MVQICHKNSMPLTREPRIVTIHTRGNCPRLGQCKFISLYHHFHNLVQMDKHVLLLTRQIISENFYRKWVKNKFLQISEYPCKREREFGGGSQRYYVQGEYEAVTSDHIPQKIDIDQPQKAPIFCLYMKRFEVVKRVLALKEPVN